MSQAEQLQFLEPNEYLAFEQNSDVRHEYVNGLVIAMAGASRRHNLLTVSLVRLLSTHLRGTPCQTYASDMKVNASHKGSKVFYYPDVMVACNKLDSSNDQYVEDKPQIIIEVLSPSTESRDRLEKLAAYTSIVGLKEYVLVHQDKLSVDVYQNTGTGWEVARHRNDEDLVRLESIGFSVSVRDIYEDVLGVL